MLLTYLGVHAKRGNKATDDMSVLPRFGDVLVYDRWAPYWTYGQIRYAICNAHILRDWLSAPRSTATGPGPTPWRLCS